MAFIWNGANANYNDTANWTGPGPGTAPPDATGESAVFNGGAVPGPGPVQLAVSL